VSEDRRPAGRAARRSARTLVAWLLSCSLVGLVAACGFNAQTNQPYTPADGTNADIGTDGALKIRNLVIISRGAGEGIVSASLIGNAEDQLTGVTVAPIKTDGADASPAAAVLPGPLRLGNGSLTVLTDGPLITVRAPELMAGLDALVTLQFAKAGSVPLRAPVVDGSVQPWSRITPRPSGGPSASPTS